MNQLPKEGKIIYLCTRICSFLKIFIYIKPIQFELQEHGYRAIRSGFNTTNGYRIENRLADKKRSRSFGRWIQMEKIWAESGERKSLSEVRFLLFLETIVLKRSFKHIEPAYFK